VSNKIYVANSVGGNVSVIDGATNFVSSVTAASSPQSVVVNPITNTVFVANSGSNNVTFFPEQPVQSIPLTTAITPLPGNQIVGIFAPTFTFTTASSFAPNAPAVGGVYFQVDTWQGPWLAATGSGNSYSGQTGTLAVGSHIVYAFAADAQIATANGLSTPLVGKITAYTFTVIPQGSSTTLGSNAANPNPAGSSITFTATVTPTGTAVPTGTVTFADGSTTLGAANVTASGANGVAAFPISTLIPGPHSITATYSGDANTGASVSGHLAITVGAQTVTVTVSSTPNPGYLGGPISFTATVTPQVGGTPTGTVTFFNTSANPATALASGPLLANGSATAVYTPTALATFNVSATYSGDALDVTSTSATPISQTVGAATFVLSITPASQTVTAGQSALYVIGIQPEGNYGTPITFTNSTSNLDCGTTLPAQTECVFTPTSVTPGTTPTTVALAVTTVAETTAALRLAPPAAPRFRNAPPYRFGIFGATLAAMAILFALVLDARRKQKRRGFVRFGMAATLVVAMGMALASCHKTTTTTTTGTPAGEYTFTVTANSTNISTPLITIIIDANSTSN
jgi:hypothetical protein